MEAYFSSELEKVLSRVEDKITRLEVHLAVENSDKSGINDKRFLIEARPVNMPPIIVANHADTTEKAFQGSLEKMKKILGTTFDKMKAH